MSYTLYVDLGLYLTDHLEFCFGLLETKYFVSKSPKQNSGLFLNIISNIWSVCLKVQSKLIISPIKKKIAWFTLKNLKTYPNIPSTISNKKSLQLVKNILRSNYHKSASFKNIDIIFNYLLVYVFGKPLEISFEKWV